MAAQREGLDEDLDGTSIEEIQAWLQKANEGMGTIQRDLGDTERKVMGKRQLIEANKAQYSRVSVSVDTALSHVATMASLLCFARTIFECQPRVLLTNSRSCLKSSPPLFIFESNAYIEPLL